MEKIHITTKDNIKLSALLWKGLLNKAVVLLHMMPATKESWLPLAEKLNNLGWTVVAPDFRGHGESEGGDYTSFTSEQHQSYYRDVEASVRYLKEQNSGFEISMVGASIGANMVIKWMAKHHEVNRGIALSAGLDYHGVKAIEDIINLKTEQEIILVGSFDDGRSSGETCGEMAERLHALTNSKKELISYKTGGHGTDMWVVHPELLEEIIQKLNHS